MEEARIVSAIEENLVEAWACLAGIPDVEYERYPHCIRYISGVPYPLCNHIMSARFAPDELDGQIESALAPIRMRGLPMLWWTGPSTLSEELGGKLQWSGLSLAEEVPGMAMEIGPQTEFPAAPPELAIREVEGPEDLKQWLKIFFEAFEVPEKAEIFFRNAMDCLTRDYRPVYRHFIGLWNGEPAACSSVFLHGDAAGLYNVGVRPAFRKSGAGLALSSRALLAAADRGCRLAVLHASSMGLPVYEKMGFREYCRLFAYLWEPAANPKGMYGGLL